MSLPANWNLLPKAEADIGEVKSHSRHFQRLYFETTRLAGKNTQSLVLRGEAENNNSQKQHFMSFTAPHRNAGLFRCTYSVCCKTIVFQHSCSSSKNIVLADNGRKQVLNE